MGSSISRLGGTPPTQQEALRDREAPSPRSTGALEPSGPLAALAGTRRPRARPPQGESAPEKRARTDLAPRRGPPDAAHPGGSAAELTSRNSLGTEASHPVGATGLPDLPQELFGQIADRLPLNDVAMLGDVNRALRATVRERMAPLRAVVANSWPEPLLDQPGALSTAFAALNQLPTRELVRERSTLMKPIAEMLDRAATPEKLLHDADAALKIFTAAGLASPVRAEVLRLIAKPIAEMLDRAASPKKLHAAALQLFKVKDIASPVQAAVLTLIANRVDRMPRAEHRDVLDSLTAEILLVLSKADMQVPLQAMARQLKLYPAKKDKRHEMLALFARQNELGEMVGTSKDAFLDPPQRAQVLVTLVGEMKSMEDVPKTWGHLLKRAVKLPTERQRPVLDGPKTWSYLLKRALDLPAQHRRPVLDALGGQCDIFPPPDRPKFQQELAAEKARCRP